ncbi:hypothetical protein [Pseudomonas sp. H3(2019)]|uniref:hypothetical protein n=1 Tax=Pseudomonas sp. H3(2019) TaxID=2598724 RepID=UPI001190CD37|nr:hypothetical protein [Pseudomonas sp. H3(2019)]TVT79311.1 hypothetical protein FPT12_26835 [Pseudomonas sp. H3(2019)]
MVCFPGLCTEKVYTSSVHIHHCSDVAATSGRIRDLNDKDFYRLINAAYVSLRDGLDLMEELQHRLAAQAAQAS